MLCSKCLPMCQSRAWGDHHPDLASLRSAAASGCYICNPLFQQVIEQTSDLKGCITQPSKYRVYMREAFAQVIIDMTILKEGEERRYYRTFYVTPSANLLVNYAVRNTPEGLPIEESGRTAEGWMKECLEGHDECQKREVQWYPRTLIEINEFMLWIIKPAEHQLTEPYAALSCNWAKHTSFPPYTESKLRGFPYSDLPSDLQEAIRFLKKLSIRYVWIADICSIQHSSVNPEHSHSERADIYSNCIISLSLSNEINVNSCYRRGRHCTSILPFEIETKGLFSTDNPSTTTPASILDHNYHHSTIYRLSLESHAWSLQERLLPPRVLSLGDGECFWSCHKLPYASESFPTGIPPALANALKLPITRIPLSHDRKVFEGTWWCILQEYVERKMKCPKRYKLNALSIIAERMGPVLGDVYIAGHFWNMVPGSLNWRVDSKGTIGPLPLTSNRVRRVPHRLSGSIGTPSWSWASMDGDIKLRVHGWYGSLAEAVAYTRMLADETKPYGQVRSASLQIRAYCTSIEPLDGKAIMSGLPNWKEDIHWLDVEIDDPRDSLSEGERYALAALVSDGRFAEWEGLVLKAGDVAYTRVGHFKLRDWEKGEGWEERMKVMFGGERRMLTLI